MSPSNQCPIAWKARDGPYPCAFLNLGVCTRGSALYSPCIPLHQARYEHSLGETTVPCHKCGAPAKIRVGILEKYAGCVETYCSVCSEEIREGYALADHIWGE